MTTNPHARSCDSDRGSSASPETSKSNSHHTNGDADTADTRFRSDCGGSDLCHSQSLDSVHPLCDGGNASRSSKSVGGIGDENCPGGRANSVDDDTSSSSFRHNASGSSYTHNCSKRGPASALEQTPSNHSSGSGDLDGLNTASRRSSAAAAHRRQLADTSGIPSENFPKSRVSFWENQYY